MPKFNVLAISLLKDITNKNRLELYEYRKKKYQQKPDTIFSVIIFK